MGDSKVGSGNRINPPCLRILDLSSEPDQGRKPTSGDREERELRGDVFCVMSHIETEISDFSLIYTLCGHLRYRCCDDFLEIITIEVLDIWFWTPSMESRDCGCYCELFSW